MAYEVATFRALREQLRCKEIWVAGGWRYRNPDEDLPKDFEAAGWTTTRTRARAD